MKMTCLWTHHTSNKTTTPSPSAYEPMPSSFLFQIHHQFLATLSGRWDRQGEKHQGHRRLGQAWSCSIEQGLQRLMVHNSTSRCTCQMQSFVWGWWATREEFSNGLWSLIEHAVKFE